MSGLRVALLNAAHDAEENRRNFRRELDANLVEYHVTECELPETFDFDGVLVTGSRASVYWDKPWIADLKEWVDEAIERDIPCLGVCYGHQLLADVLGGNVEDMGEYEIGYREVTQSSESPLFEGLDSAFTVFTTHSDRVVELPPGATQIAENEYGIHGFQKDGVFSVQFHPEYDMATAEMVTKGKDDQLSEETLERVLAGIDDENYAAACEAKTLFDNFLEYIRSQQEVVPAASADDD